jgi:hypothetical protein
MPGAPQWTREIPATLIWNNADARFRLMQHP